MRASTALLIATSCLAGCVRDRAVDDRPRWAGGGVDAVRLPDGGVATLSFAWRTGTALQVPPRLPRVGTVSVRVTGPDGTVRADTVVADGLKVRPVGIGLLPDGIAVAVHQEGTDGATLAEVVVLGLDGTPRHRTRLGRPDDVELQAIAVEGDTAWVAGTTRAPLYGTLQSPGRAALDAPAGFVARLPRGEEAESFDLWAGPTPQTITALAPRAGDRPAWLGTTRERGRPTPMISLGPVDPTAWPDPAASPAALAPLGDGGLVVAGWAPDPASTPMPGAESLTLWVTRLDAAGAEIWRTTGCCASWRHPMDLAVIDDTVRLATRADAGALTLGGATLPAAAGLRGVLARLDPATGPATDLRGGAALPFEPMALPVAFLGDCGLFGDGDEPTCPPATPAPPPAPPAVGG